MTIQADLEHAHASLTQVLDGITSALAALGDANGAGYPSKASGAANEPGALVMSGDGDHIVLTLPERIMDAAQREQRDPAAEDRRRLSAAAHDARVAATHALDIISRYQRRVPVHPKRADAVAPADWCTSCWRDNQHHSPVTLRPSGQPFYADLCRWCGDFQAAHKRQVPIEILRVRHQGKRVTMTMIDALKPVRPTKRRSKR